jgi:O-antigen ligase
VEERLAGRTFGPFSGQSAFAGFLVIMSIISTYSFISSAETKALKWFWIFIYIINVGLLISTGNRMGFVTYLLSTIGLLGIFIRTTGVIKSLGLVIFLIIVASIAGFFVLKYTEYNTMIDRLVGTQFYGIEVDSRRGLMPYFLDEIAKKPVFGHRPRFGLPENYDPLALKSPPHNFYLFVAYTVGLFGLFCYLLFFFFVFLNLLKALFLWSRKSMKFKELPLICMLILIIFLIQQYSVAFIRYGLRDYQQIIFLLIGIFCTLHKIARHESGNN